MSNLVKTDQSTSSLGVVSRLKNWINKPSQIFHSKTSNGTDSAISSLAEHSELQSVSSFGTKDSNSASSHFRSDEQAKSSMNSPSLRNNSLTSIQALNQTNFNPPLSIDFVCKLKRPTSLPNALEYNNNQTFQGTLLEDWLMQSLDDHLANQLQHLNAKQVILELFVNSKQDYLSQPVCVK